MRKPSDDLFQLIRSLSTQEKVHFKKYAKRHSSTDNHYILLFDAINKMKQYDEAVLRTKLKNNPLILKNLKRIKNYTLESILNCLSEYYSNDSVSSEIRSYLHNAEILVRKNQLQLASRMLDKTEHLVEKYQQFEYLLIISRMRYELAIITDDVNKLEAYVTEIIPKDIATVGKISNHLELRNLNYSIHAAILKNGRNQQINAKAASWISSLLSAQSEGRVQTLQAKYLFHHTFFLLSFMVDQPDRKNLLQHQKWVEEIEAIPNKEPVAGIYISALGQLIALHSLFQKSYEVNTIMQKIVSFYSVLPNKYKSAAISSIFLKALINYTHCWISWNEVEYIADTWNSISKIMPVSTLNTNVVKTLYANLAHTYLLLGRLRESLKYLNKIINEQTVEYRMDLQIVSRIYRLIIYYDLNNVDHLEYQVKATERWFRKHNQYKKSEEIAIELFKRLVKEFSDKEEKKQELVKFKEKLLQLQSGTTLSSFILVPWLASKINKTLFVNEIANNSNKFR